MTKNTLFLGAAFVVALFVAVSAKADFTMPLASTGQNTQVIGQGVMSVRDTSWSTAFLGEFEIGYGDANHNGVQIGGTLSNGAQFTKQTLFDAAASATYSQAFVYDRNTWPLGDSNSAWADMARDYPDSNWIGDFDHSELRNDPTARMTTDKGYYAYKLDFTLDEALLMGDQLWMSGIAVTDNAVLGILLNGVEVTYDFLGAPGTEATNFATPSNFYFEFPDMASDGNYSLTFIVNNHNTDFANGGNPGGLWALGMTASTVSPVVPEPSTMLIFGAGLVGACLLGRRRLRKS